jgi:F-type H+-transporting ATPase subunit epsilon
LAELHVELVAADRKVWSGDASLIIARTTEGDLGVLPGHAPMLGVLVNGAVQVHSTEGGAVVAAVHGGFLSVADDQVSILAEVAELSEEIDVDRARQALDRASSSGERSERGGDDDAEAAARTQAAARAETRLRAAELAR